MRLFGPMYERAIRWSRHPHAERYLAGLSFAEAFIFPVMPEIMLAPMAMARPARAFRFATVSLVFSVLGSLVGYALGHFAFEALRPLLADLHLLASIEQAVGTLRGQMNTHFWGMMLVLLVAALQPVVPMKFITWASGIVGVPMIPFLLCMVLGRGKRVYLLALLVRLFGKRAEDVMHRHIERIGWVSMMVIGTLFGWWFLIR